MKKVTLIFALAITVISCGTSTSEPTVDTTKSIDSTVVDSVKVTVDSVKADSATIK